VAYSGQWIDGFFPDKVRQKKPKSPDAARPFVTGSSPAFNNPKLARFDAARLHGRLLFPSALKPVFILTSAAAAMLLLVVARSAHATDDILSADSITARTVTNNNTLTISRGKSLTTSGSTVAIIMSGTSTLTNNGTIQQTGSGRAIDNSSASSILTVLRGCY
jgi:hypothetical protein